MLVVPIQKSDCGAIFDSRQPPNNPHARMQPTRPQLNSASLADAELLLLFAESKDMNDETLAHEAVFDTEALDDKFHEEQYKNLKSGISKLSSYRIGNLLLNGNLTCRVREGE
jgi:hypothetical protein